MKKFTIVNQGEGGFDILTNATKQEVDNAIQRVKNGLVDMRWEVARDGENRNIYYSNMIIKALNEYHFRAERCFNHDIASSVIFGPDEIMTKRAMKNFRGVNIIPW